MIRFEPDEGNNDFQINGEGGYYDKNSYPGKTFASCKHEISIFLQLSIAACLQVIVLMAFWWKDGKKTLCL